MEEKYEYVLVKNDEYKKQIRRSILSDFDGGGRLKKFSQTGALFTIFNEILLREGVRYGEYDDAPGQEFEMFPKNCPSVMYIGLRSMYGTDEPMDYYFMPYAEFLNDLQEVKKTILEDSPQAGSSVDEDLEKIKALMKLSKRPYDSNDYVQDNNNTLENDEPWTLEKPEE